MIGLKIEPSKTNSNDEFDVQLKNLRAQLQFHNIQMTNNAFRYKEEGTDCEIQLSAGKFSKIELCRIPGDGNCLFGATVHQRYHFKVDSDEYKQRVAELRKKVVAHININLKRYERILLGRIYDKRYVNEKKSKTQNVEEDCKNFLDNCLSKEHYWAGPETIQAICELFKHY